MAAAGLWHRTGRLLEMAPARGGWPRLYSRSPAFADVLRLPQKQLTKIVYPLRELAQYLVTDTGPGLIEQRLFDPSLEDITRAERVFEATARNRVEYLSSAVRLDHAPSLQQPEVRELELAGVHVLSPNVRDRKNQTNGELGMDAPLLCAVPVEDHSEPQCGCWESNPGSLEQQPVFCFGLAF